MALLMVFLLAAAASAAQILHAVDQPEGFISIDSGLDGAAYKDDSTNLTYVPDAPYVDVGENHPIAAEYVRVAPHRLALTVRSFPPGRSCYTLPTVAGVRYLVAMDMYYGNYDGKASASVSFDLHIGVSYWDTVRVAGYGSCWAAPCPYHAVFLAWASWAPVCLVDTGGGTPFVSLVLLRPLGAALYPPVTASRSLGLTTRLYMGDRFMRYPTDPYDRYWWWYGNTNVAKISTNQSIQPDARFQEPQAVLQVAAIPRNGSAMSFFWQDRSSRAHVVLLHFADFQSTQSRRFNIYLNGNELDPGSGGPFSPPYLAATCIYNAEPYTSPDGKYNVTLAAAADSELPPMLNAFEVYKVVTNDNPVTFPRDFDAIMAIKIEYQIKKNWMGDPCYPARYSWDGIKCSNMTDNTTRITSLDLSHSRLSGIVSNNFTLLSALEYLDLSYNNLSGPVPDSLASLPSLHVLNMSCNNVKGPVPHSTNQTKGSISFRYTCESGGPEETKKAAILAISVAIPTIVLIAFVSSILFWRKKLWPCKAAGTGSGADDHANGLLKSETRRFMYDDVKLMTGNFERFLGRGGFGPVYYGRLVDGTEVAVKLRSDSSFLGLPEFVAEVQSLTRVHHKNLVSLVGYCWDEDRLALVYEYMSNGNLCDHLRPAKSGGVAGPMDWGTRLRVVLEAAQGLDYLHNGCDLPIIHRDLKTSNILLNQNLRAKIADFGLSRAYFTDSQTHISTTVAGTVGYMDPEYYNTGRVTKSSDVYSFGVVLLEVATGEPPVSADHGNIVQRVRQEVASGDIVHSIADARLGEAYDARSMWEVIDTALMCTADAAVQRPTMAAVIERLKESLALEEARES